MHLWGFEGDWDPWGEDEGGFVQAEGTQWEWWRVLLRVAATPVTLAADGVAACCVGVLSFEWLVDDDDDDWVVPGGDRRGASSRRASAPPAAQPAPASGKPLLSGVRAAR